MTHFPHITDITDITSNPDALPWAANLAASRTAYVSIYFLDGQPIHAHRGASGWQFWRSK